MKRPKLFRFATVFLGAILLGLALWLTASAYVSYRVEAEQAEKDGIARDEKLARELEKAKTIRIMAAGFRYSSGGYCGCTGVNPPVALHETSDPEDLAEFGRMVRFRRTPTEPPPGVCGPLTFDFARSEEVVFSFNYRGSNLTDESDARFRKWLEDRQIWSRLEAARAASANAASKK